jgi:aminopeptidase N
MKGDYIIVHESGHEWFGNNITSKDVADMWIHEGFTDYSETLFTEMEFGKKAGNEYVQGLRNKIANDKPVIGDYGVNKEGSTDMYYKGSQLVHIIRQEMQNDSLFRAMLREMNQKYRHQSVSSKEIEHFISTFSGIEFKTIFDQYLRRKNPPLLVFSYRKNIWYCKWQKSTPDLQMPVKLNNGEWIKPTEEWKPLGKSSNPDWEPDVDANFYVLTKIIAE